MSVKYDLIFLCNSISVLAAGLSTLQLWSSWKKCIFKALFFTCIYPSPLPAPAPKKKEKLYRLFDIIFLIVPCITTDFEFVLTTLCLFYPLVFNDIVKKKRKMGTIHEVLDQDCTCDIQDYLHWFWWKDCLIWYGDSLIMSFTLSSSDGSFFSMWT